MTKKLNGGHCQCSACNELFNSVHAFDKHRTGAYTPDTRRCLSVNEMETNGMTKNAGGWWITGHRPASPQNFPYGPLND